MKSKIYLICWTMAALALFACNSGGSGTASGTNQDSAKSPLIQNGSVVTDPNLNAMIPLIYRVFTEDGQQYGSTCTGTLIDSQTVLTAAHCVLDMSGYKPAGQNYTSQNIVPASSVNVILPVNLNTAVDLNKDQQSNWNVYSVAKIYINKSAFNGAEVYGESGFNITNITQLNDLAILKLSQPVDKKYKFATLASTNPQTGQQEVIAGYGVDNGSGVITPAADNGDSNVLRYAISQVNSVDTSGTYIDVGAIINPQIGYTKICQGDSGGPDLIAGNNGSYVITGVHSFGNGSNCGSPNAPSSSVSVAYYNKWIAGGYLTDYIQ